MRTVFLAVTFAFMPSMRNGTMNVGRIISEAPSGAVYTRTRSIRTSPKDAGIAMTTTVSERKGDLERCVYE